MSSTETQRKIPISSQGYAKLQEMLAENIRQDNELTEIAGDAFGGAADWHDNAAYDQWRLDSNLVGQRIAYLKTAIDQVEIIKPETLPGPVNIGHMVEVQYEDEKEPERFTILGPYDNNVDRSWISFQSDLGEALLGKDSGAIVELPNGLKVTILRVLAGNF
jgi:transcription elongation factor GreA